METKGTGTFVSLEPLHERNHAGRAYRWAKRAYDLGYDCVVKGKYAYCTNYHRLFRVNINTGKVKRLATTRRGYIDHLVVKGNYIYYSDHGNGSPDTEITRINLSTGKRQILAKNADATFVVKGSKIYYCYFKSWQSKGTKMVMSLS